MSPVPGGPDLPDEDYRRLASFRHALRQFLRFLLLFLRLPLIIHHPPVVLKVARVGVIEFLCQRKAVQRQISTFLQSFLIPGTHGFVFLHFP